MLNKHEVAKTWFKKERDRHGKIQYFEKKKKKDCISNKQYIDIFLKHALNIYYDKEIQEEYPIKY